MPNSMPAIAGVPNRSFRLWFVLTFFTTALVYFPGLDGPFIFDDLTNIVFHPDIRITSLSWDTLRSAFWGGDVRYPERVLSRGSFALSYYFAGGLDPFWFKVDNLSIHLLNGLLIFALATRLLKTDRVRDLISDPARARWLALVITAIWLLHPIQLTTVLYVVQRMTSMAATFTFAGLWIFVVGRQRFVSAPRVGLTLMAIGIGAGTVLGFLSKENGALLPFLAYTVELLLFSTTRLGRQSKTSLNVFYALMVGVPAIAGFALLFLKPGIFFELYPFRDFTPWQRVLSELRVLFFYLGLMVFPNQRLFAIFHDDFDFSANLFDPWTTLVAALAWVLLFALAAKQFRHRPLWVFALLWYVTAHAVESSIVGLELVFEHRNYVPSFGLIFVGVVYMQRWMNRLALSILLRQTLLVVVLVVIALSTFVRANNWSSRVAIAQTGIRNHPQSDRYAMEYGGALAELGASEEEQYAYWIKHYRKRGKGIGQLLTMALLLAEPVDTKNKTVSSFAPPEHVSIPKTAGELPELPPLLPESEAGKEAAIRNIDLHIRYKLAHDTLTWEYTYGLGKLRRCMGSGFVSCIRLGGYYQEWSRIPIEREEVHRTIRIDRAYDLGQYFNSIGNYDLAEKFYEVAFSLEPESLGLLITKIVMDIGIGRIDTAKRDLTRLQRMDGESVRWKKDLDMVATMLKTAEAKQAEAK